MLIKELLKTNYRDEKKQAEENKQKQQQASQQAFINTLLAEHQVKKN
jgi:hypothetical protein